MTFDTTDTKNVPQDGNAGKETADAPSYSLSPTGQRAMQGDDTAALEQRVEQLRAETEAREAAEMVELDRQAAVRAQMAENQAMTAGTNDITADDANDSVGDADDSWNVNQQRSFTEAGDAAKIESGAEQTERTIFADQIEPEEDREGHSPFREGRI